MLHFRPTHVLKLLISRLPFCFFSLCSLITTSCSWLSSYASCLLSPSDFLRVPQWDAGGLRARSTDTSTLLHCSFGSRFSPGISFALFSLALSCSSEVLQDLGSDHLTILLSVPLSPVFCPNERPPSYKFQKASWDDFVSYFDSHCPSAEEYSLLSLSFAGALFTSLALNATKSSITFGRIKRHSKAWWSAEVEGAVSERRKAFAAAYKSDEDRQAYISASRRASSVIAKAKAEAWQKTCSSLSPKSNPKTVYFFLRSIAGPPSSFSYSLSVTVLLPGNRIWFMPLPEIPLFRFSAKGPA